MPALSSALLQELEVAQSSEQLGMPVLSSPLSSEPAGVVSDLETSVSLHADLGAVRDLGVDLGTGVDLSLVIGAIVASVWV